MATWNPFKKEFWQPSDTGKTRIRDVVREIAQPEKRAKNTIITNKEFWAPSAEKVRIRDVGREIGSIFTEGTRESGKIIGDTIAEPIVRRQIEQSEKTQAAIDAKIFDKMRENRAAGKSNGNLIKALSNRGKRVGTEDIIDSMNLSNKQIVGSFGKMATEVLSGSIASKGAGVAKGTIQASRAANLGKAGKAAAFAKTAFKEAASTVPFGYASDVFIKMREGKSLKESAKPGVGTLVTGGFSLLTGANAASRLGKLKQSVKLQEFGFNPKEAEQFSVGRDFQLSPKLRELGDTINKLGKDMVEAKNPALQKRAQKAFEQAKKTFRSEYVAETQGGFIRLGSGEEVAKPPKFKQAEEYVAAQRAKAKEAKGGKVRGVYNKAKAFYRDAKSKAVDFNAPIIDTLKKNAREYKYEVLPKFDIEDKIDRSIRSNDIAGQFLKDGGFEDIVQKVDDMENLDQYMIAKQMKRISEVKGSDFKTGRDAAADNNLIEAFGEVYEPFAKKASDYSRKILDYTVDSGLIAKDLADELKVQYPDYVPVNRIFELSELPRGGGTGRGNANLSKQTVVQKLVGSEREVESPMQSLMTKTYDAIVQGERNKAAQTLVAYKDLPGNPFQLVPLRTAENINARIDLYSEAKILKPLQNKIDKLIKTRAKSLRTLNTEVNNLNKAGVKEATKKTAEKEITKVKRFQPKQLIEQLINEDSSKLKAIKAKIENREPKVAELIDSITVMKEQFDDIKSYRGELFDEAKLLKDVKARGKDTISVLRDGVKEIYETTPDIARAAKALNVEQMGLLGKIFSLPTRVLKLGTTGISIPFTLANVAKDQVSSFINSSRGLKSSIANPIVFGKALWTSLGHGKMYDEMIRNGAMFTSFDISRNQAPKTLKQIRANRNVASKALYTVTHPGQLLRAAENIMSRTEEFTRAQQYVGTKRALMKEGRTVSDAVIEASKQSRSASGNFARRGEWGQVVNAVVPYLNASIQGNRSLIQAFAKRPKSTTAKLAATVLFPMAAITAWNLRDEKRKEAYDDMAEYEKENNFIIVPPNPTKDERGRWNVIKIPITPNIANLGNIVRKGMVAMQTAEDFDFVAATKDLIGSVSPVEPDKQSILSTLTPQAIKPTLQSQANYDFFTDRPIVPKSMERLSPEKQKYPWTAATAAKLAEKAGWSPLKVEAFIKSTFGSVGGQALNVSDRVMAAAGLISKDEVGGTDIADAAYARFGKAAGGASDDTEIAGLQEKLMDQADEGFELKAEAESLYKEYKGLSAEEANNKAKELKKTNPRLFEKLKDVASEEKLGLSYDEKLVKQLQVKNGERAKYIFEKISKLETAEEKNAYIADLRKKKIISDDVLKQIKKLAKSSK